MFCKRKKSSNTNQSQYRRSKQKPHLIKIESRDVYERIASDVRAAAAEKYELFGTKLREKTTLRYYDTKSKSYKHDMHTFYSSAYMFSFRVAETIRVAENDTQYSLITISRDQEIIAMM